MTHPSPRAQSLVSSTSEAKFPSQESHVYAAGVSYPACPIPSGIAPTETSAGHKLTDSEREAAIERAARAIERHMAAVHEANNRVPHVFSDFADASASRWMANELRKRMEMLIAGRKK